MAGHLKTLPEYFQAVIDGRKPMEIRYNDRNFKSGDRYILKEFKGSKYHPACADFDTHECFEYDNEVSEITHCPLNRRSCYSYTEEVYTGRRCLIRIKEVFPLDKAGLPDMVAFTFDILNITDKKAEAKK